MKRSSEAHQDEREYKAIQGCSRILSYVKRPTVRERLDHLIASSESSQLDRPMDVYGNRVVADLEVRVAELLGFPAAAFFPTGIMAQLSALRCWAEIKDTPVVAAHPLSHIELREEGALCEVGGLRSVHPTREPRCPTAAEVRAIPTRFGTLILELPLRDAGFVLPTWEALCATVAAARERGAAVHFDGARLWECTPHFGRTLPEIAGLADSVYVSFYKSLGGLSGAALAGSPGLIDRARVWRHRQGGLIFHQFPAALAALTGLQRELPRLPAYVAQAALAAESLKNVFAAAHLRFRIHPYPPHTHQFQVWLPYPAAALQKATLALAEEQGTLLFGKWRETEVPGSSMTEVTIAASGLEWSAIEITRAAEEFLERVGRDQTPAS